MEKKMTRHEMREIVFSLLFQSEFYPGEEFETQRDIYLDEQSITEEERQEIAEKTTKLLERLPEIDEKISEYSKGWQIDRIAKAELAILRVAVYEALFDESVPVGVAVNEAVELAKQYGEDNGSVFINGILGKIVNE